MLTPWQAIIFLKTLNRKVCRFGQAHGTIKDYDQPTIPQKDASLGKRIMHFISFCMERRNLFGIRPVQ